MPVVVVFLGGIFWRRATATASIVTLVVGWPIGLAAFIANEIVGLIEIQFLYLTGIMLGFSLAVFVAVTLATEAPVRADVQPVTWSRRMWREETADLHATPGWRNYRPYAFGLILITLLSLIPFL